MFPTKLVLFALMISGLLSGVMLAQGTIITYAGSDALFAGAGQPAIAAQIVGPQNIVADGQGNVYFCVSGQSMVLKISSNGVISIFAGNGLARGGGDNGPATGASLGFPQGLAIDSSGNIYITDTNNANVRKVDTHGIITTVAGGQGGGGFAGDGGPATQALLSIPMAVAVDQSGNLYILDTGNERVRMVNASGMISTIAGTGAVGLAGDGGPATKATFSNPAGMAIDSSGNLYIADNNNGVIRRISNGIINTVAGTGGLGYNGDNIQATKASLGQPRGVAVDASGNIYIADTVNERIRRVDTNGVITTIAGNGQAGFSGDGSAATSAMFSTPAAVAVDATGNVYVADLDNNRVRRVVPGGSVTTFAGTASSVGDNGPSTQARLDGPAGIAVDSAGNLYIADSGDNRIRKVTPSGAITTVAGNGQTGSSGDNGPATAAALNGPGGVAVDSAGNLYIADAGNNVIRRVSASTGIISVFAGNHNCCYGGTGTGGDGGLATAATLYYPTSVTVDMAGNVYFTDLVRIGTLEEGVAVRRVTTDGKINTWAGGGPAGPGFSGDGQSPLNAQFGPVIDIKADPDGTLYIADRNNNRVRKVDQAGATITTVAGNGQLSASGNGGPATAAGLDPPWSVALDAIGNLYIASLTTVRKVTVGANFTIGPFAGNGQFSFSGDGGPATAASLAAVSSLAADSAGNLFLTDSANQRIRQVQAAVPPSTALSPTSLTFSLTATGSTPTSQTFSVSNLGQGTLHWSASTSTTSGGAWLSVSPTTGGVLAGPSASTVTVTANPAGLAAGDYYGQVQVTSPNTALQSVTVRLTIQTAGENPPVVVLNGVLNAASYSLEPVAPGTLVSIFGSGFTDSSTVLVASTFPWPSQLGGTSLTIGGEPVPMYVVTPGQINAILPFDLPVNTSLPVVVTRNNAVSAPGSVVTISSLPGVFTQSQNGLGIGIVVIVHADGSQVLAGNGNSAQAGDALVIYCTGLGDVSPRAVAGSPAPISPLSQAIDPVTLTIGGVKVPTFFAGPTPGFTGLYQVNAIVPSGIAPNPQAPLVLSQGGLSGGMVTSPMQ